MKQKCVMENISMISADSRDQIDTHNCEVGRGLSAWSWYTVWVLFMKAYV